MLTITPWVAFNISLIMKNEVMPDKIILGVKVSSTFSIYGTC